MWKTWSLHNVHKRGLKHHHFFHFSSGIWFIQFSFITHIFQIASTPFRIECYIQHVSQFMFGSILYSLQSEPCFLCSKFVQVPGISGFASCDFSKTLGVTMSNSSLYISEHAIKLMWPKVMCRCICFRRDTSGKSFYRVRAILCVRFPICIHYVAIYSNKLSCILRIVYYSWQQLLVHHVSTQREKLQHSVSLRVVGMTCTT